MSVHNHRLGRNLLPKVFTAKVHHTVADVTLVGEERGRGGFVLIRIHLGAAPRRARMTAGGRHAGLERAARLVKSFLEGKLRDLSALPISYGKCSAFRRRVSHAARRIPWGSTVSYAELARMAGCPRAVRAVASVMRNNPFPLVVPCHRVIRSDGTIGGFGGKLRGKQIELKRRLLRLEGVVV